MKTAKWLGRGDKPNQHDILTGSKDDGTAYFLWEKAIIPAAIGHPMTRAAPALGIMTATVAVHVLDGGPCHAPPQPG
jgi:hypothetical protein